MARSWISWCGATLVASGLFVTQAVAGEPTRSGSEAARPCPKHGAGFVRIPGSATCIRLSGRVGAGLDLRTADRAPPAIPPNVARLAIDTRTDTDYGPVRTFVRIGAGHR